MSDKEREELETTTIEAMEELALAYESDKLLEMAEEFRAQLEVEKL